jgi:asparagine synthase (glutamine-hydrolysing)
MCGINGIFVYSSRFKRIDRAELKLTREYMAARGPDGKGEWVSTDERVGFGHQRLSIIDTTEGGAQPMASADRALIVSFNGEIYNYREIRKRLESKGYLFRSNSDTEVLLHLYSSLGQAMVGELRGMFAFAIWDSAKRGVFLARDPYGIKPLYYADDGNTFRFASQVKALLAGGNVPKTIDPAGLVGFQLFGSVPEPWTTYRAIRCLPAGTTMFVSGDGASATKRYHSIAATYASAERQKTEPLSGAARLIEARDALLDSVRSHLVADVPVGAFLSAGIDSSALVGLMRDAGQNDINTVTLSFKEYQGTNNDEASVAAEVARTYGTRHTTRVVTRSEFLADLPNILAAMDQPSIDGVNTWFVSKAARECGLKVAVSGVGGDELLGGYNHFKTIPRWVRWLQVPSLVPGLGYFSRRLLTAIGPERFGLNPKSAGLLTFGGSYAGAWFLQRGLNMPWEIDELLEPSIAKDGLAELDPLVIVRAALDPIPAGAFARVATMEASLYMRNQLLRDTDWASMAHSLEVRTPLVDSVLLSRFVALGPPERNATLKQDLAYAPLRPLPASVSRRVKTGFSIPTGVWLAGKPQSDNKAAYWHSRKWARHVAESTVLSEHTASVQLGPKQSASK